MALVATLLTVACSELPEVQYHREGFDLAVEFDHPVCEGTLLAMEERVAIVERETDMDHDTFMTIYWLSGNLDRVCPRDVSGCFIPGTQVVASTGRSLHHEIVHAVLNTRGSNPFTEEGMAEVLSGVAAFQDVDERAHPLEALSLTSKDAREGSVDYHRAAHFMHFVRAEAGEEAMAALADAVDRGDGPGRIVSVLEQQLGRAAPEIEDAYAKAPRFYPSGRAEETPGLSLFDFTAGINVSLNCHHEATFGPISEDAGGMYHLLRIEGDAPIRGTLFFNADRGVRASLFREVDPDGEWVQDWWHPAPGLDDERIDLRGGERAFVSLDPADHWLLMVRSGDADRPKGASLRLRPAD